MNPNIKTGTYTGGGAALQIELGFSPDYVRVLNITDGNIAFEWFAGMTNGHAFQTANHGTDQQAVITSNGISAFWGEPAGKSAGFTAGTALAVNNKVYRYIATRNGAGA